MFGKVIAALLEERGITAYALAKEIGVRRQAIYQWLHDEASPTLVTANRIAVFFSVSLDVFRDESVSIPYTPTHQVGRPRRRKNV